jgi:hypothetical protein
MATRTPTLQPRNQHHRDWGNYATAADLPNASGAPLAAGDFVLEVGDTAYVSADTQRYHCTAVGTAGGGDAVWSSGGGSSGGGLTQVTRQAIPQAGGSGTDEVVGMASLTNFGSSTTVRTTTPASATWLDRQNRNAVQPAVTANSAGGKATGQLWALGQPTIVRAVVGFPSIATSAWLTSGRALVGLLDGNSSYLSSGTQPSNTALIPAGVYLGIDSGDANLQIMHKSAAGVPATKIDLGAAFSRIANLALRLTLTCSPGQVDYLVERLDTAVADVSGSIVANIPPDSALLRFHWQCATNATGTETMAIDCIVFQGESSLA